MQRPVAHCLHISTLETLPVHFWQLPSHISLYERTSPPRAPG